MRRSTHRVSVALILPVMLFLLVACGGSIASTEAPAGEQPAGEVPEETRQPDGPMRPSEDMPVQLHGEIEVSNFLILDVYFTQRYAFLEDLSGFVKRDYEYEQPLEGQYLGPVFADQDTGTFNYLLNLPTLPDTPLNDVDNDENNDSGVAIWQVVMNANLVDDPFLGPDESGGWSSVYTSAHIDSENKNEIDGGLLLVWSPDADQRFPTGFGDDGLLFTEDDPTGILPAGYSVVNLDAEPFEVTQEPQPSLNLMEGDIQVNDFSEMGWAEAFDALFAKASLEYPFTDVKGVDWEALYDEFAPLVAEAETNGDAEAYFKALQGFAWSIPDGHVGLVGNDFGGFQNDVSGSYGFAPVELSDGRFVAVFVSEGGPAAEAGMKFGAELTLWNGDSFGEAVSGVIPWSSPFSNSEALRTQQLRYLVLDPAGTEVTVAFQNPGESLQTVTLIATPDDNTILGATSVFAGFDSNALPVEYEILDSGYGYIAVNSLSDNLFLTIQLWERAIDVMIANDVPGIIIDLRQNSGGAPIGTYFAGPFVAERIDVSFSYYYSEESGEFETFGPPDYIEPDDERNYDGQLAVLVSTACSSACENVAYVLGLLPQARVFGFSSTNGIYGEVGRGQYLLPGQDADNPYSFQIPTGYDIDPEGNLIIEGPGVVPDVRVPLTEETILARYQNGDDVVLDFAVDVMDQPLGAGVVPDGLPAFSSDFDLIAKAQASVPFLEDLAREEYSEVELASAGNGDIFTYTIPLNTSRETLWAYGWCTATQEQFDDNWSKIQVSFTLDGEVVPLEDFGLLEADLNGPCRFYFASLTDWPVGEHLLLVEVEFTAGLNDGSFDYTAGTRTYEYRVYIAR